MITHLDLQKEAKRCGNCQFCKPFEILVLPHDATQLRLAAKKVLGAKPDILLPVEHVINLLTVAEHFQHEKIFCQKEKVSVGFLDPACSLWQPRRIETHAPERISNPIAPGGL